MVTHEQIQEVGARIVREFRPLKVILFGSHADGTAGEHSDVDLLVVLPFEGSGFRKSLEIMNRIDVRFPLDLIARTPLDVARRYEQRDPLIRQALDRGRLLYERDG